MDDYIVLSEAESAVIGWCKCCRMYTLSYKSCCASFDDKELGQFQKVIDSLRTDDFQYHLSATQQVLLKTPSSKVGFCLTEKEVERIQAMISQAILIREAYQLIQS